MKPTQNLAGVVAFPEKNLATDKAICIASWVKPSIADGFKGEDAERIFTQFPDAEMTVVHERGNHYRVAFSRRIPNCNSDRIRREAGAFAKIMSRITRAFVGLTALPSNQQTRKMSESAG